MTTLKIDGKPSTAAADALEPHVRTTYNRPGHRLMVVGELEHVERTQPAPGSDKEPSVKCRITHLEVARGEQEDALREAQRVLYLQRTARGTLDDDTGQLDLSERTLELTGGTLAYVETARVRAGLAHWSEYARRVQHNNQLTDTELRRELKVIANGLSATLAGARDDAGDEG
jgi:hypothetical protein